MAEKKEPRKRAKPPATTASAAVPADPGVVFNRGDEGRVRAVIDVLSPVVDGGRFVAKRIAGERVCVEAHCFTDGHDQLRVVLAWRAVNTTGAYEVEMQARGNDVWTGEFTPPAPGRYRCTITAWVDPFESWRKELERREELGDIRVALQVGSALIASTAVRAGDADAQALRNWAELLLESASPESTVDAASLKALALDPERKRLMQRHADRSLAASATLEIFADRKRAGFSSWYELFPRSAASQPARHGNFKDVEARLPYIAGMGFDVLEIPVARRLRRGGTREQLVPAAEARALSIGEYLERSRIGEASICMPLHQPGTLGIERQGFERGRVHGRLRPRAVEQQSGPILQGLRIGATGAGCRLADQGASHL